MASRNALLTLLAVVLAGPFAVWWIRPPAPVGERADPARFSAARAGRALEWIAAGPRPAFGEQNALVRERLARELQELGFEVRLQRVPLEPQAGAEPAGPGAARELVNVLARRRGTEGPGALMLTAHHDSVPDGPGAGDDGAAVAALLETLRALGPEPRRNDLIVLLTDGEELGLLGAKAFAESDDPWLADVRDSVRVVCNFEARGAGGPSILFQTGPSSSWLVERYARVAPHPFGSSLAAAVFARMPNDTDFTVFLRRGLPGLNFAFLGGGAAYHRASDRPDVLDPASLQHQGENMLALARDLLARDLQRERHEEELEFFPVPGGLLRYPRRWTLFAAGALALLAAASAALRTRSGSFTPLLGALAAAGLAAVAGAVAVLLGMGAELARGELVPVRAETVRRGANLVAGEWGTVGAWWSVLGFSLTVLLAVPVRRRAALFDVLARGSLLFTGLFAVASAVAVPGGGHVGLAAVFSALCVQLVASRSGPSGLPLALSSWVPAALVLLPLQALLVQVGSVLSRAELVLGGAAAALALAATLPLLCFACRELPRARARGGLLLFASGAVLYVLRAAALG